MKKQTLRESHPQLALEWDHDKNDKTPDEVSRGSVYMAKWMCSEKHSYPSRVDARTKKNPNGCPYCSGRLPIVGVNDLQTTHPDLAKELVDTDPTTVKAGTNRKVLWRCRVNSGHVWPSKICHRALAGSGCPTCSNQRVDPGFNDLATTHPEIAKELIETDPTTVLSGNDKSLKWWCDEGHSYTSSVYSRAVLGITCTVCSGSTLVAGVNDLGTTHPDLSKELIHPSPTEVSAGMATRGLWRCGKGHEWEAPMYRRTGLDPNGCPECFKAMRSSKAESILAEYIRTIYSGQVTTSDRKVLGGLELDVYLPDIKTAIEYNGTYFHSEKFKDSDYHKNKLDRCAAAGVRLINVWEDDYRDNRELVHSMLAHKLGVSQQRRVSGNKTTVLQITNKEAFPFLNANHIQGQASGTYYLGLKEKSSDLLVAVMVLKRTKDILSLERYATAAIVMGGQSKILSYVDKNIPYETMITFADNSISDGKLYTGTGWVADKVLPPDYRYLVNNRREHKFGYRLKRFREDPALKFEEGLSEKGLAELNGMLRIWDHGKVRYTRQPK